MNCKICLNEGPHATAIYNDCVIECLEKIKIHYMNLKKQLCEHDLVIKTLKETNGKLEKNINYYHQDDLDHKTTKKRRTACPNDNGSELLLSQINDTPITDKSVDDLNMALNDEKEFEISFISNTPIGNEEKQISVNREPMMAIPLPVNNKCTKTKSPSTKNSLTPTKIKRKDDHVAGNKENSKTSNWISKESELRKTTIRSFYKTVNTKHVKKEQHSNLSLKPGRLRQSRLQLHISKNLSNDGDSTFCEEAIEASPESSSKKSHKSNSSRQWLIRNNVSDKVDKRDADSFFDISIPCTEKSPPAKATSPKSEINEFETSSVVMLTPATQDIIFLDDSSESFNIESMDLLRDLMNPTESHMSNLRRLESNRIKMLQKTVNDKTECHANKEEKHELVKTENKSPKSNSVDKADVSIEKTKKSPSAISGQDSHIFKQINESPFKVLKVENQATAKKQHRLFEVDCNECQAYIKHLGANLSDEEIQQHIRNCTKHTKRVEINLTPDGFWDPLIRPLSENDPRNQNLIDTRFVGKERRS